MYNWSCDGRLVFFRCVGFNVDELSLVILICVISMFLPVLEIAFSGVSVDILRLPLYYVSVNMNFLFVMSHMSWHYIY